MEASQIRTIKNEIHQLISVPLVQQCYSWDCGLACISMVLRFIGEPSDEVYTKDLDFLQCGESIWTIDLAYILGRYGIPHTLYTITVGANTDYAGKAFYKKSFTKDEERINIMFENAFLQGVHVENRSVMLDEIMDHLSAGKIAIVLVDWCLLECVHCDLLIQRSCMCCFRICPSTYQGHFIVLCGFDKHKGVIFYKNPGTRGEDVCSSRFEQFEKARKSHGTDEDILFVHTSQNGNSI